MELHATHTIDEPRGPRPVRVLAAALEGVQARIIDIEASANGSEFSPPRILGLPDAAVREAYHRVRTAFQSMRLSFPRGQVVVNLAPACTRKAGSGFDLGIALAIACLAGAVPRSSLRGTLIVGELGLDGSLRAVPGILPMVERASELGIPRLLVADEVAPLAHRVASELNVLPVGSLEQAIRTCTHGPDASSSRLDEPISVAKRRDGPDLARVRGQDASSHALTLAAAGGHNLLMSGPPGCGKTLLARCMPGLLPRLCDRDRLAVARIRSAFSAHDLESVWSYLEHGIPPFRAPHHTISYAGLVGGGSPVHPGEVTLAHRGVLFLDELPEFQRSTLEALRQPLESGAIHVRRAAESLELPARFQLVVAMNPCPCGHRGHPVLPCTDTPVQVQRYRDRISGPLLDRIDIHLHLAPTPADTLLSTEDTPPKSARLRARVGELRQRQITRQHCLNATLSEESLRRERHLSGPAKRLLLAHCRHGSLSARGITRVLRVARTVADWNDHEQILDSDLAAALAYRMRL